MKPMALVRGIGKKKKAKRKNSWNRRRRAPFAERAGGALAVALKVIVAVLAVPALVFCSVLFYNVLITTEYLEVRSIDVAGIHRVPRGTVVALSGVREGENIFSFKYRETLEALESHPWVASAQLRRIPPHTVRIELKEKEPVALVKGDDIYVMDSAGVLFAVYSPTDSIDLPVVTGVKAAGTEALLGTSVDNSILELMAVLDGRDGFGIRNVSEINVASGYGLALYTLAEGVRLELGYGPFEDKLRAFERVVSARGGSMAGIEAMDIKSEREVVVRFKTDVVEGGAI